MKTKYIKTLVAILIFSACACGNFIDIDPPKTQISGPEVFNDIATAQAAMGEVYVRCRDKSLLSGGSSGASYILGLYTDELQNYNASFEWEEQLYRNNLLSSTAFVQSIWNENYNIIYLCNRIIDGVANGSALNNHEKDKLIGEATFVRSLIYYYLSHLFGDIPYTTTTNYEVNRQLSKTSYKKIREQLIADLHDANDNLNLQSDIQLRTRPNKWAVQSLLARIYLEGENWNKAFEHASNVWKAGYELEERENVFLKDSRSTIWHLLPSAEGANTQEAKSFIYTTLPPPKIGLTAILADSFEENDLRKTSWINTLSNGSDDYFHAYKYKESQGTSLSLEYSIMFRIEEILYIMIEAAINTGRDDVALNHWNILKTNNNLDIWTSLPSNPIDALMDDRRNEFFCENGHRFIDLKRTGKLHEQMTLHKPTWQLTNEYWPIPESEILLNPNLLPQNDGY